MKEKLFGSADVALKAWFEGQADDDDVIAFFLPTQDLSPLERLRMLGQSLNFASQMKELTEYAIMAEAEATAEALRVHALSSPGPQGASRKLALEDHFSALQMLVSAEEAVDEDKLIEALELAERASEALSAS